MRVSWTVSVCAAGGLALSGCAESAAEVGDAAISDATAGDTSAAGSDSANDAAVGAGDSASNQDGADTTSSEQKDTSAATGAAPTQSSVEAQIIGRSGRDILISFIGEDPDKDVTGVRIRTFDASGNGVLAFQTTLSGVPDSDTTTVPLDAAVKTASFVGTATLRDVAFEHPTITTIEVSLRDAAGNEATTESVPLGTQDVKGLGEACDPEYVESRCGPSLGCRGTPAACSEGLAPTITKLAYLTDATGTRLLVAGEEPEDDIASLHLEFLTASGTPALVDLDADGSDESETFDLDATGRSSEGTFFVRLDQAADFSAKVPQIAVSAVDAAGHTGERKTVKVGPVPLKGAGGTCDPRGFDGCSVSAVCWPGPTVGSGSCKAVAGLRTTECAEAPLVEVEAGTTTLTGHAAGTSLWDAPLGCSSGDPVGRPEGTVRLRLAGAVGTLTVTTNIDGTNFDTVVYVMASCGADGKSLVCGDDTDGPVSSGAGTVVMEKVAPGDYLVVVDSWSDAGGAFGLSITAE